MLLKKMGALPGRRGEERARLAEKGEGQKGKDKEIYQEFSVSFRYVD